MKLKINEISIFVKQVLEDIESICNKNDMELTKIEGSDACVQFTLNVYGGKITFALRQ